MGLAEMTWNIPLWFDIWLAGMAGGAYLVAFLADRYSGGAHKNLFRLAVYSGVPLAIIGVLLLVIDLGNPLWFWHLFTTFKPVAAMSMGVWILSLWLIFAFIMMIAWVVEGDATRRPESYPSNMTGKMRRVSGFLGWVDLILAVLLMTYPGVLLANTSQAIWASTLMLPALFVASAVSTGVALLILMSLAVNIANRSGSSALNSTAKWLFGSAGWEISRETIGRLTKSLIWIIAIELAAIVIYAIWLGTSSALGASEALALLATGALALPFWLAVILLGLLIPLVLLVIKRGGMLAAQPAPNVVLASAICVLLGGLALRAVMVIGGQL